MSPSSSRLRTVSIAIVAIGFAGGAFAAAFRLRMPAEDERMLFTLLLCASVAAMGWGSLRLQLTSAELRADVARMKAEIEALKKSVSSGQH